MAVSAVYVKISNTDPNSPRTETIFSNISATTGAFQLGGGRYAVAVIGSSFGSVKLQYLGPDGSTYLDLTGVYEKSDGTGGTVDVLALATFVANGVRILELPQGHYKLTLA